MAVVGRQEPVLAPVEAAGTPGVPRELAQAPDTFALRVKGDSLTGEQLHDGDVLLVQSAPAPQEGETVVALVRGEAAVGRLHREGGKVLLRSADQGPAPVAAEEEDVDVRGVVVAVIRKY